MRAWKIGRVSEVFRNQANHINIGRAICPGLTIQIKQESHDLYAIEPYLLHINQTTTTNKK